MRASVGGRWRRDTNIYLTSVKTPPRGIGGRRKGPRPWRGPRGSSEKRPLGVHDLDPDVVDVPAEESVGRGIDRVEPEAVREGLPEHPVEGRVARDLDVDRARPAPRQAGDLGEGGPRSALERAHLDEALVEERGRLGLAEEVEREPDRRDGGGAGGDREGRALEGAGVREEEARVVVVDGGRLVAEVVGRRRRSHRRRDRRARRAQPLRMPEG